MSESLLSLTIIFAQFGALFLIIAFIWLVMFVIRLRKDNKNTKELVEKIKKTLPLHRTKLTSYFKDECELEQAKVKINVDTLISDEAKLYDHLIKVSVSKDTSLLKLTTDDIDSLINDYVRLLTLTIEKEADTTKESKDLTLKKENEALRIENASLQKRLDSTTATVENMMGEFSSMYEGGKKEGEQRVKNEMYKLKQSLKEEEIQSKSDLDELDKAKSKEK